MSRSRRAMPSLAFLALCFGAVLVPAAAQDPPEDLIVDGGRVLLSGSHTYRNVVVSNRGRIEIRPYAGTGDGGKLEIVAEHIELDRYSSVTGDGAGYRGRPGDDGEGPGGGEGGRRTARLVYVALIGEAVFMKGRCPDG